MVCYATHRKCNRGRGVFPIARIYPVLGNGYVFYGPPRDHVSGTEPNQERERERERDSLVEAE
jgi:hypothetical protein